MTIPSLGMRHARALGRIFLAAMAAVSCGGGDKVTGPNKPVVPQTTVSFLRSSTYNGSRRLMLAEIGATDPTPITPAAESVSPAYSWAPDGQRVAYGTGSRGVRIINRDGSGEHVLAGSDTIPPPTWLAWSPDGRFIASTDGGVLWIIPSGGGTPQVVTTAQTGGVYSPVWSPDSRRIAITSPTSGNLGVVTASSGSVQMFSIPASHPDWSPDGSELAIESGPPWGIYTVNADGTQRRPVAVYCQSGTACVDTLPQYPHWSPDGLHFAVHIYPYDVGVMNADGSNLRVVPALESSLLNFPHPSWSRDGRVLFLAARTGLAKPFVMNADTSNMVPVTSGGFYDAVPRWVP